MSIIILQMGDFTMKNKNIFNHKIMLFLLSIMFSVFLVACGGGGGRWSFE
jgi:hypothetical protein